jgi:hypothetical protein
MSTTKPAEQSTSELDVNGAAHLIQAKHVIEVAVVSVENRFEWVGGVHRLDSGKYPLIAQMFRYVTHDRGGFAEGAPRGQFLSEEALNQSLIDALCSFNAHRSSKVVELTDDVQDAPAAGSCEANSPQLLGERLDVLAEWLAPQFS